MKWKPGSSRVLCPICDPFSLETLREWWWRFRFETSDEPAEGGKDAFSTGGAYAYVPANLDVNVETEGIVNFR